MKKKYEWKELIAWDLKDKTGYKLKADSSTVISLGAIISFMFIASQFSVSGEESIGIFFIFIVGLFFLPVIVDSGGRIVLANKIQGLTIAHIELRHVELGRTFQIRDVIIDWKRIPYKADPKASSSSARNRAGLELTFKHAWNVGTPENPHQFKKMQIFGTSSYFYSLFGLAPFHQIPTDIFGIIITTGIFDFSLKISEKQWDATINQYIAISWATQETAGTFKIVEPFLVKSTKEKSVLTCVHCNLPQSRDEARIANHYDAQLAKEQTVQATLNASHEQALRDQVVRGDLKYGQKKTILDDFYEPPSLLVRLNLKRFKWWEWIFIGIGVFVLLLAISPGLRLKVADLLSNITGGVD